MAAPPSPDDELDGKGGASDSPVSPTPRFVVVSRFVIANDFVEKVKEAFRNRPRRVEQAPGFIALEVLSPVDAPAEIHLMTWWTDEQSFRAWHRSHAYHDSHAGIPRGLKLDPRGTLIRYFEEVAR